MTTIAHPTDATGTDHVAFAHATALASRSKSSLVSVHVGSDSDAAERIPDARALARRWDPSAEPLEHERVVHDCCVDDPSEGVLNALEALRPDLVVAATHRRGAVARIFRDSEAEAIASNVNVPSLLIPLDARGFVDPDSGDLDLHRVLVPVGDAVEAAAAVRAAAWMLELAGATDVEIVLLRVGGRTPDLTLPERPGWRWVWLHRPEQSLEDAVDAATEDACVIVMATRGHDSIADVLTGSHTERVLHRAACPVLSVPVT